MRKKCVDCGKKLCKDSGNKKRNTRRCRKCYHLTIKKYIVREIPIPKDNCFLVIDGTNKDVENVLSALKDRQDIVNDGQLIFVTNKEIFFSEPRYTLKEAKDILKKVKK